MSRVLGRGDLHDEGTEKFLLRGNGVPLAIHSKRRSPFDGTLVAMVHEANEDMVSDAVTAGHDISIGSQSKLWGALPIKERLAIIHDFADKLLARA